MAKLCWASRRPRQWLKENFGNHTAWLDAHIDALIAALDSVKLDGVRSSVNCIDKSAQRFAQQLRDARKRGDCDPFQPGPTAFVLKSNSELSVRVSAPGRRSVEIQPGPVPTEPGSPSVNLSIFEGRRRCSLTAAHAQRPVEYRRCSATRRPSASALPESHVLEPERHPMNTSTFLLTNRRIGPSSCAFQTPTCRARPVSKRPDYGPVSCPTTCLAKCGSSCQCVWKKNGQCANGLHGWEHGIGDISVTDAWQRPGCKWQLILVEDAEDNIDRLDGKVKFREGLRHLHRRPGRLRRHAAET